VCAVITPWNFPMAIHPENRSGARMRQHVVFKPATLTPLSALNFVGFSKKPACHPAW
jgi:acyl-CoA reductase-like NAD-dependent aldehyde dehydrogenase